MTVAQRVLDNVTGGTPMATLSSEIDTANTSEEWSRQVRELADGLAREQSTLDTWHRVAVPDQGNGYHSCRGCGTGWYEPRGRDQESPHKTDCWVVPLLGLPSSNRVDESVYARLEAGLRTYEGTRDALRHAREDLEKAIQRNYHERLARAEAEVSYDACSERLAAAERSLHNAQEDFLLESQARTRYERRLEQMRLAEHELIQRVEQAKEGWESALQRLDATRKDFGLKLDEERRRRVQGEADLVAAEARSERRAQALRLIAGTHMLTDNAQEAVDDALGDAEASARRR